MGQMNIRNALGAAVPAFGMSAAEIAPGLATFLGVARRQEFVGEVRGITIIDDFAHHPTAVTATIEAVRLRYPNRRLWAVFEPRSNTCRRRIFQKPLAAALALQVSCGDRSGFLQTARPADGRRSFFPSRTCQ